MKKSKRAELRRFQCDDCFVVLLLPNCACDLNLFGMGLLGAQISACRVTSDLGVPASKLQALFVDLTPLDRHLNQNTMHQQKVYILRQFLNHYHLHIFLFVAWIKSNEFCYKSSSLHCTNVERHRGCTTNTAKL